MATFIESFLRLALKRHPRDGQFDVEGKVNLDATNTPGNVGGPEPYNTMGNVLPDEHPLNAFRLMTGITASHHLGFRKSGPAGTRPAANIGIYARVVDSEQKAKDSHKVFSIVINACYFLQIIVAAALTAMGAANVDNKAVTAFGAINTVIAGLLTFLKGSGLPGRLKYFGNEWKKVREYIEQREREFSHPDCTLDLQSELQIIERMYAHVKQEIELNQPESYSSVTAKRASTISYGLGTGFSDVGSDIRGFGKRLTNEIDHQRPQLVRELTRTGDAARDVKDRVRDMATHVSTGLKDLEHMASHMSTGMRTMEHKIEDEAKAAVALQARNMSTGLRDMERKVEDEVKATAAFQARATADALDETSKRIREGHDDEKR